MSGKQWLPTELVHLVFYVYHYVLIEVDSQDVKVGGFTIKCLSHLPIFPGKVGSSIIIEVAGN